MIHKTYKTIAAYLAAALPEILWTDRDKGQLETPDKFNSVQVPGLLLDFSQIEWIATSGGNQTGTGTLTASLVMRLPVATYQGAKESEYPEFATLPDQLHEALSALSGLIGDRRMSDDYFTEHFYVFVQTYDIKLYYRPPLTVIDKPAPAIQATVTIPQ